MQKMSSTHNAQERGRKRLGKPEILTLKFDNPLKTLQFFRHTRKQFTNLAGITRLEGTGIAEECSHTTQAALIKSHNQPHGTDANERLK